MTVQVWLGGLGALDQSVATYRLLSPQPKSQAATGRELGVNQVKVSQVERSLLAQLSSRELGSAAPIAWRAEALRQRLGPRARFGAASTIAVLDWILWDVEAEERPSLQHLVLRVAGYRLLASGVLVAEKEREEALAELHSLTDAAGSISVLDLVEWSRRRGLLPEQLDEFLLEHDVLEHEGRYYLPRQEAARSASRGDSTRVAGSPSATTDSDLHSDWDELLGLV